MRGRRLAWVLLAAGLITGCLAWVAWHFHLPSAPAARSAPGSLQAEEEEIRALMRRRAEEAERAARPPLPPIPKEELERFAGRWQESTRAAAASDRLLRSGLTVGGRSSPRAEQPR